MRAVAIDRGGAESELGARELLLGAGLRAPRHLFCRKPFETVYIDSGCFVYPYPDCQTVDPFGRLNETGDFHEIWFGETYRELRRRIVQNDPPRMCRVCGDFINRNVDDAAFFSERDIHDSYLRPIGVIDDPQEGFSCNRPRLHLRGWALSFAGIDRVELLREPLPGDPPEAIREDGRLLLGLARHGDHARRDVARLLARYPDSDHAGWSFVLHLDSLPAWKELRIHAVAYNSVGGSAPVGKRTLRFGPPTDSLLCGAIEQPWDEYSISGEWVDVTGWAVTGSGPATVHVEVRGPDGWIRRGVAMPHRKRRPAVTARYPSVPGGDRAGWRFRLRREELHDGGTVRVAVFANGPGGARKRLGERVLHFARPTRRNP